MSAAITTNETVMNSFQNPNWYVDNLLQWLDPVEWAALSFMIRHIYGWRDKIVDRRNRISLSQFVDGMGEKYGGCGLSRPQAARALKSLVRFGVVSKVGEATKDGQEWELLDTPRIDWSGLQSRREAKAKRGQKRVSKAAAVSAEKRKADDTSTPDVPATSTPSVPHGQYAQRTSTSTPNVPLTGTPDVHTKPNNKHNFKPTKDSASPPKGVDADAPEERPFKAGQTAYYVREVDNVPEVLECTVDHLTPQMVAIRLPNGTVTSVKESSLTVDSPALERKTTPLQDVIAEYSLGITPEQRIGKNSARRINAIIGELRRVLGDAVPEPDELRQAYEDLKRKGLTPSSKPELVVAMINRYRDSQKGSRNGRTQHTAQPGESIYAPFFVNRSRPPVDLRRPGDPAPTGAV